MLSVIIPTLNAERRLASCLAALVPAVVDGLLREVIIADGGSRDRTLRIAEQAGARLVHASRGRGSQVVAGIKAAKSDWILVLHADTVLSPGWWQEASAFMDRVETGRAGGARAAAFRFALDDHGVAPRLLESLVGLRCNFLKRPYGDQGLLMPRAFYNELGGYRDIPIMEDVDLVVRIGARRLTMLRSEAVTAPDRFVEDGYLRRVARNQLCLALYSVGWPIDKIARIYASPERAKRADHGERGERADRAHRCERADPIAPTALPVEVEKDRQ